MNKQNQRVWLGGGAGVAVLVTAAAWFLMIGPEMSHAADLRSQQQDAQTQNQQLQAKTNALKAQSAELPALRSELTDELQTLPTTSNLAELTRQLTQQATFSGVGLTSITASQPTAANGKGSSVATGSAAGKTFGIQINLTTVGSLGDQRKFVLSVQHTGPRAALVTSTVITPTNGGSSIDAASTMNTQLTVFVTPVSAAEANRLAAELGQNTSD